MSTLVLASAVASPEELRYLVAGMSKNSTIHTLDISGSDRLGVKGFGYLSELLQSNCTLKVLHAGQ